MKITSDVIVNKSIFLSLIFFALVLKHSLLEPSNLEINIFSKKIKIKIIEFFPKINLNIYFFPKS